MVVVVVTLSGVCLVLSGTNQSRCLHMTPEFYHMCACLWFTSKEEKGRRQTRRMAPCSLMRQEGYELCTRRI